MPAISADKLAQPVSAGNLASGAGLAALLLGRAIVFTLLLGAAFFYQYTQSSVFLGNEENILLSLWPIYGCTVFVYGVSLVYALVYRLFSLNASRRQVFVLSQIALDILVVSYLLVVSGGSRSVFLFLYLVVVIYAGLLAGRRGAFIAASLCSAVYPLALLSIGRLTPRLAAAVEILGTYEPRIEEVLYAGFVNLSSSFLTAALVSYAAERLRRTGEALVRSEVDYRALEALHREIVTHLTSGIITLSPEGRITYLNHAAETMLGKPLETVYQHPLAEAFPEIHRATSSPGPRTMRQEARVRGAQGGELDLGFSVSHFGGTSAGEGGTIVIFQDLTNLKRAEERLKHLDRLAAIGEMAAGIAHEIRNPLAAVLGSIDLLGSGGRLNEEDQRLMGVLRREIVRLDNLITNFLHYSRPVTMRFRKMDLDGLVQEVLATMGRIKSPPVTFEIEREGGDFRIEADPDQVKQVLWNLILNARQAMDPKGGKIRVRLFRRGGAGPGASCGFSVSDSGPGIPKETLKKLFTPFFTSRPDGTGLGLAMVDRIVGMHGGIVDAENLPEGGARFTVVLPLEPPELDPTVDADAAERPG